MGWKQGGSIEFEKDDSDKSIVRWTSTDLDGNAGWLGILVVSIVGGMYVNRRVRVPRGGKKKNAGVWWQKYIFLLWNLR